MNSLTAHNFQKVNLLEAYNTVNKLDIICLLESFLHSSILTENSNLKISWHKMVRTDHPNNLKRGCVCAYIRESLPVRNFSNSYLSECLTLEVTISNKKGYVITLYIYIDSFISNLEKLLINTTNFDPHFVILVYINGLAQGLRCSTKLFADDTLLFSTITSPAISSSNLNEDLLQITQWAYQWKISFNPDITKQAQEITFSRKKNDTNHASSYFNNARIQGKSI